MNSKDYTFIRYGSCGPINQKGYKYNAESFHSPPTRYGFYAFPLKSVELFLLGGGYGGNTFEQKLRLHKKFIKNKGSVWHHLENVPQAEILARKGSWIKTSMLSWRKAYQKTAMQWMVESKKHEWHSNSLKPFGVYAKDTLEVFFDEKI